MDYASDMDFMSFAMDMGTGEVPGTFIFNESKGYIAYDIPDNVRGMEMLTVGVTTDMQMMIDPSAQVMLQPQQSGAVGNDRDNTYFRKDW